jgi:LysM repeat protein
MYGVTAASIAAVNSLPDTNALLVGEALAIPTQDILYTVRYGDTLYGIANTLGTTVQAIVLKNGIANPDRLSAGQVLHIPARRLYDKDKRHSLWHSAALRRFRTGHDTGKRDFGPESDLSRKHACDTVKN